MNVPVQDRAPDDLYITGQLKTRPQRNADYLQEKRAFQKLAALMLDNPGEVLPQFVALAMEITGGISAGLSLYESEPAPGVFRWRYLKGVLAQFENATTPRNHSPCGVTLDSCGPTLTLHPERFYSWISDAGIVVPEVLLVPLYIGGTEPLGTLWIVSGTEGHFDQEHARIATEMASFVGIALRMLKNEEELKAALESQEILAKEMSHRVKNLFAVAEGMVRVSLRSAETKDEMGKTLIGRFHALAGAHALVRRSQSAATDTPRISDFSSLVKVILQPHERAVGETRFRIDGPALALGEQAINGMALVLHELATNSAKHGAAGADNGQIDIVWTAEGEAMKLRWKERGGPLLSGERPAEGYGSKLLNDTVRQFKGTLAYDWHQDGLTVSMDMPVRSLGG